MSLPAVIEPTWTWGSSARVSLSPTLGLQQAAQLAQVTLPEPAVCSLYFEATVAANTSPSNTSVRVLTLNLNQGLGRVTIPRTVSFNGQPSTLQQLQWTMPFVPLHSLQVDVSILGDFPIIGGGEIDIQMYFVIAPLTHIEQKQQKLKFGMSVPGEADSLDDELLENLEEEAPSVSEIMGQEAHERVHGTDDDDDDDGDEDEPQVAPKWMLDLVDALAARLGRAPTRAELGKAVARMRERAARKAR